MVDEVGGPSENQDHRVSAGLRRWRRKPPEVAVKPLAHAPRLALRWGLAGLLLGSIIGGMAGLWFAMLDNALYGIGSDNYSGPLSRTTEQARWVYLYWLGFGIAVVGGPFAVVCALMGFLWGIVEARGMRPQKQIQLESAPTRPGAFQDQLQHQPTPAPER